MNRTFIIISAAAALLAASALSAQTPSLVADVNPVITTERASSSPVFQQATPDGTIFLSARHPASGLELWKISGDTASLVKDIRPGVANSRLTGGGGASILGSTLIFNADDGVHGRELWRSDGTAAGTTLVKDVTPGATGTVSAILSIGSKAMFIVGGVSRSDELWITDGTAEGTTLVFDLNTQPLQTNWSTFTTFGGRWFFFTNRGIWVSDGTAAGTTQIATTVSATLTRTDSTLLFLTSDATHGYELWKTDGTAAGTSLLKDIFPGASSAFTSTTRIGTLIGPSTALFFANDGTGVNLWKSDGTEAGTQRVKSMYPAPPDPGAQWPQLFGADGFAYFTTTNALWRTDATEAGTFQLATVTAPRSMTAAFGQLYFFANQTEPEMWTSDGSVTGTRRVMQLPSGGNPSGQRFLNGKLYFSNDDGVHGIEPWVSDGTAAGTRMFANIAPEPPPARKSSNPLSLRAVGERVYFLADDETSTSFDNLWRSDGTAESTAKVASAVKNVYAANGYAFYVDTSNALWRTDGTEGGTIQLAESAVVLFEGTTRLFYRSVNTLWQTDGTLAGSVRVHAFESRNDPRHFAELAGRTYFSDEEALWSVDGAGARVRVTAPRSNVQPPTQTRAALGQLVFVRWTSTSGSELWRSDGIEDGTVIIKDIRPGEPTSAPTQITPAGAYVFFVANDGVHGAELWRSDGTADGTVLVRDITAGSGDSGIESLRAAGPLVYFLAHDGTSRQLWRSDGTTAGTFALTSLPGMAPVHQSWGIGDTLWFTADDGVHGAELWRSDGTVGGTAMHTDIDPGAHSSAPRELVLTGNRIFFAATTVAYGRELWAMTPDGSIIGASDVRIAEGNSGTAMARFVVRRAGNLASALQLDYITVNGTASAGTDYVAQSGTLSFAPGETTKFVDVIVNGENDVENEESFFLLVTSAGIERARGVAIISADDRRAELSIRHIDHMGGVSITNAGPSSATDVRVRFSHSPSREPFSLPCGHVTPCTINIAHIAAGETVRANTGSSPSTVVSGVTFAASMTAAEPDANPADNFVESLVVGPLVLPTFLTAGSTAQAMYFGALPDRAVAISSAGGAIVASPASFTESGSPINVTLTAGATPGVEMLRVQRGNASFSAEVDIVAPGGTGKRAVAYDASRTFFWRDPLVIHVRVNAMLHDGTRPTGTLQLVDGQTVKASAVLDAEANAVFSLALPPGTYSWALRYEGDTHFRTQTMPYEFTVYSVATQTAIALTQNGCTYDVAVTVHSFDQTLSPQGEVLLQVFTSELGRARVTPAAAGKSTVTFRVTLPPGQNYLTARFTADVPFAHSVRDYNLLGAPTCAPVFSATASASGVTLTWTPHNANGVVYEVFRSSTGSSFIGIGTTTATTLVDASAERNKLWYYFVRARETSGASVDSNVDVAVNVVFTDDPISGGTRIRAAHVEELRGAVNVMRAAANLTAASFGPALTAGEAIRASHFLALRDALAPALSALGLPPIASAPIPAIGRPVRTSFVQALRNAVK
jgi:ELWxxDGT repeat protein